MRPPSNSRRDRGRGARGLVSSMVAVFALLSAMLIGTTSVAGSCAKTYTVVAGDGCWAIANSNGIDVVTLQSLNPAVRQRMGGKIPGGYYPNWSYYHNGLMGIGQMGPHVTHIIYGFSTISYSPELDVWYLDSADLWADMGDCVGVDKIMCQTKDKVEGCMPFGKELECEPGKVSLVPTLGAGAGTGKCPVSTCYNAGGVPDPPRTIPCDAIFDERMGLRTKGGAPQMCGQFNWILNTMPSVSPDTRVETSPKYIDKLVESIGSWLDVIPFDGVDIDWEFPGFEHGGEPLPGAPKIGDPEGTTDSSKGACHYGDRRDDGARYNSLITKLRQRLNRSGLRGDGRSRHGSPLEISIAAPAGFDKLEKLQLKTLCDNLDRFHLMTYDFHGAWDGITNHQ
ncbi:hypothetical protein GGF31_000932, partial [Allomyces arbusculus]